MTLGQIGAWIGAFTVAPAAEARPAAREIEDLGYDTLWYPEGLGTRESFTNGAVLLGATERLRVASGIANIWARDPVAAANAARVLADAFDDRFLLGLGVSHPRQVDPRGHRYEHPVERMSAYLDAMDDDPIVSPDTEGQARPPVPRVLAALGPGMLRLAAEKALGAGAAERARSAIEWYLDTPNYVNNLRRLGFTDADLADGGSDALVEALVAAGDEEAIRVHVKEHLDAGATQVAIQPLEDGDPFGGETLRRLAPVLL